MVSIKKQLEAKQKIVVTAALPYANGEMHVGHVLEHIQVDIYTRFLRLVGKDALLICASDMHGTPIEVNAKKAGKNPEEYALPFWEKHQKDFAKFLVKYDNYYKTHSPENKEMAYVFYKLLKERGYIYIKEIPTVYCSNCKRHLPDRFVKGTCPHCNEEDQYGDICEKCSTALKGVDLVNAKCTLCENTPEHKNSAHYFFKLKDFSLDLRAWVNDEDSLIQKEIKNWISNWIENGLDDWCISRDEPYFGFEVPNCLDETGEKKYLYVWLDAPIGYISSTINYCETKLPAEGKKELNWEDYWRSEDGQVLHFIGKDIAYFHYLFWPAVLKGVDFPVPVLTTHGFVNLNGMKMSKSRGNYFSAAEFFELFGAEGLRFYYANRLDRTVVDLDLNLDDFEAVNNKVLIANLGNFCYRSLSFAAKNYSDGFDKIANGSDEKELIEKFEKLVNGPNGVKDLYYEQDYKGAVKLILQVSDLGNVYFQKLEPWKKRESAEEEKEVKEKIAFMLNLARNLSILVKPILPIFSTKIEKAFGVESVVGGKGDGLHWEDLNFDWTGHIEVVEKLVDRVDVKEAKKRLNVEDDSGKEKTEGDVLPLNLRAGQVVEVKNHPNAEKLYVLQVDFGENIGKKQIVSGLRGHFEPNDLLFHKFLFCINLQPVKLRGEVSEGMILVAEEKMGKKCEDGCDEVEEKLTLLELKPSQFEDVGLGVSGTFGNLEVNEEEIDFKKFLKVKMKVQSGKVVWKEKVLNVAGKDLGLVGVKDGAKIT